MVILAGGATAAAGPIGFIGLTVPHVARAICGPDCRWILPWSTVLAPTLLLGADVAGRLVARPGEVRVGILTAIIGVNAGAAASAVFMIVVVSATGLQITLGALAGSTVTSLAIHLLAYKRGVSGYRLVLSSAPDRRATLLMAASAGKGHQG